MAQTQSIRFRLLLAFFLGFLLVAVLGLVSLWRLTGYHAAASHIRDTYLPNTQFLGDLNNFTSDFRAAEAAALLAAGESERQARRREIEQIDGHIAVARQGFEHVPNLASEVDLYQEFVRDWQRYREGAERVLTLSAAARNAEATELYNGDSRMAYDKASEALDVLTERNRLSARDASLKADTAYEQALWLILAGLLLAGAILLSGLTYFRRSILQPLLHLAHSMHRLADQDMDIQVEGASRNDEIGEMARAMLVFRGNAVDLAVNQRTLAEQASLLGEKLAHERRLTQLQRNFVSMASHEFRTPLTIIDGEAQRLFNTRNRADPDSVGERAGTIRQAVARMTGVISNLIESARLIEEGADLFVHPTEFDLAAVLDEVCGLYRAMAPHAPIVAQIGERPLTMVGDQKLLFQVFSNMMSNAVKYSRGKGAIHASAERRDHTMVVVIQDGGMGIPAPDIGRVFDQHFRGSNVSGVVGTGIGLYLVKTVIDLHGGGIAVESIEGQGATFTVTLPVVPSGYGKRSPE